MQSVKRQATVKFSNIGNAVIELLCLNFKYYFKNYFINMSIEVRVEEWLRKMGYTDEIPSSLSKICNPSTTFIWEQLITNVKPRMEVEHVRKNIIVNRLTKKPLDQQDQFSYPIKEIQTYMEKRKLEKKIEWLENTTEEKKRMVDELLNKNKMLYIAIDHKKAKIKENLEKKYLLDKKSEKLTEDIQKAEEVLTQARNLTPVEMDENANGDEIRKTLQKCAEKLQKLSEGVSVPKSNTTRSLTSSAMKSKRTPKRGPSNTFSKYLNQSTVINDIVTTSKKLNNANKENVSLHQNGAVRCLFTVEESDSNKSTKPKRESLGLLPNDCFNVSDEIDNFLLNSSKTEPSLLQPLSESSITKNSYEIIETLGCDKNVKEILKKLLYQNNRFFIMIQCKNIFEHLLRELRKPILESDKLRKFDRGISQTDLSELYFIHAKNELEKDKCRLVLKKLHDVVKRRKDDIFFQLCNKTRNVNETRTIFELQIEEAYLSGTTNFLRKEIESFRKIENNNHLQVITLKIKQVKEQIVQKLDEVENLITNINKVLKDIRTNREETTLIVEKLGPLIHDFSWASPLTQSIHSQEIETFKKVPLEYNRKFKMDQSKTFYRSVSDTTVPSYIELDSNTAEMLTLLMDKPFSSAESVIFNALRTKVTLNTLRSLQSQTEVFSFDCRTYTPEELTKREEYVEPVMNQLWSLINSPSVKEVLSAPNYMREVTDLWLEMPLRNFISDKRRVDGHDYKYYEKVLDEFYNSLPSASSQTK